MSEPPEYEVDKRFANLRLATESLRPSPGFSDRVLLSIAIEEGGWFKELTRSARRLVPIAGVVAGMTIAWAYWTQSNVDDMLATSDTVELEW